MRTGPAPLSEAHAALPSGLWRIAGIVKEEHTREPLYSLSEEVVHAFTHGLGLVASVGGLVTLVVAA